MALSYNANKYNISYVIRATSGGTVFSANLVGTAFDYFTDTAIPNDAIYFTTNNTTCFSDLYLNVATPLVGVDVVLVWEYYAEGIGWRPIHDLTDGSNGFTTAGAVRIRFPIQAKQFYTTIGVAASKSMVRCRIVSLTSISEGGANTVDTPQYSDGYLDVTGYTDASPCYWETIYSWLATNAPETKPQQIAADTFKFDNIKFRI